GQAGEGGGVGRGVALAVPEDGGGGGGVGDLAGRRIRWDLHAYRQDDGCVTRRVLAEIPPRHRVAAADHAARRGRHDIELDARLGGRHIDHLDVDDVTGDRLERLHISGDGDGVADQLVLA